MLTGERIIRDAGVIQGEPGLGKGQKMEEALEEDLLKWRGFVDCREGIPENMAEEAGRVGMEHSANGTKVDGNKRIGSMNRTVGFSLSLGSTIKGIDKLRE